VRNRIGLEIAQPEVTHEAKFIVDEERIRSYQGVAGGTAVDEEAGIQYLLGCCPATWYVARVQDLALAR